MLVGDAGGFPCPLEAEGVYQAMETGRIAAEIAAEALSSADPSEAFVARYEQRWRATSVGQEFEAGAELAALWRALPFSPQKNTSWFVPMTAELLGGIFDWSEHHAMRMQQVGNRLQAYAPPALPFIEDKVIPLPGAVYGDEIRAIRAQLAADYRQRCLECGACDQVCTARAIRFRYPPGGTGVVYEQG